MRSKNPNPFATRQRWTLEEIFTLTMIIVVCFVILIALANCGRNLSGASAAKAKKELTSWLSSQYPSDRFTVIGSDCNRTDSNSDNYVSCSATVEDRETKKIERISVECNSGIIGGGCREQRIGGYSR